MNEQARIKQLERDSYAFDVEVTLDELEWTRILGRDGFGSRLLREMATLGGPLFRFDAMSHLQQGSAEIFEFSVDNHRCECRLDYEQPLTASLLSAVGHVFGQVNRGLRRSPVAFRYLLARDQCTGAGSTYRMMVVPTAWLSRADDAFHIVAGMSLDDLEASRAGTRDRGRPTFRRR